MDILQYAVLTGDDDAWQLALIPQSRNRSREGPRFNLDSVPAKKCFFYFRFKRDDIKRLVTALKLPKVISTRWIQFSATEGKARKSVNLLWVNHQKHDFDWLFISRCLCSPSSLGISKQTRRFVPPVLQKEGWTLSHYKLDDTIRYPEFRWTDDKSGSILAECTIFGSVRGKNSIKRKSTTPLLGFPRW